MTNKANEILKNIFGYDTFRPLQQNIIRNILNRKDTLAIMPTGGGKSLCYQIPALIFDGITLVISPLISLMKDQVEQLDSQGIHGVCLNSSLGLKNYQKNVQKVLENQTKILFMAPETLMLEKTQELLNQVKLSCITVDEAHCISEWGHDFRPEYRQLIEVRKQYPNAVCLALTATATERVRQDIKNSLGFQDSNTFIASFDRKNLFLQVVNKSMPYSQTTAFLDKHQDESGIIYCFSRNQVDELTEDLVEDGYSALPYHAGLDDAVRKTNQEKFIKDDVKIIVATIAFGMGINKPDVRFILHYDLPANIESYYQQIGRAGRDGLDAHCLLLYSYQDARKQQYFIDQKEPPHQHVAQQHLNQLITWIETYMCRRKPLLGYFGETYASSNCRMCDRCTSEPRETTDVTIAAQKFFSCVKRTGERFGAGHITDILRGSESQKVFKFNHDKLSTYGIGAEYSKKQWMRLARQFIEMGYLKKDVKFGSLQLTGSATPVLRSQEKVYAILEEEAVQYTHTPKLAVEAYDQSLFEELRALRKSIADQSNIPPYIVFPDQTLIQMASRFPLTEFDMLMIHGVGDAKLKRYGKPFLTAITQYCKKNNIEPQSAVKVLKRNRENRRGRKRFIDVGTAFNNGASIQDLTKEFSVTRDTIMSNLNKFVNAGNKVNCDRLLAESISDDRTKDKVFKVFEEFGTDLLGPVHESLEGAVPYDELKLLRIVFLTDT